MLKKCYRRLKKWKDWYERVWKAENTFHVPLAKRLKYALMGFTANEFVWFDLEKHDAHDYISEYERINSREINGVYKAILDSKILFEEIFRHYVRVPAVYAWISDGIVYGLHGYEVDNSNLADFIRELGTAVLKQETGAEGKGTYIIAGQAGERAFSINGAAASEQELLKLLGQDGQAILCEYMRQSEFENSLYPDAANTLRIVCGKKRGETETHVIKAVQRIGNDASRPVDNVSAGAIACPVDLETGRLGMGCIPKSHERLGEGRFFARHPDTGCMLEGKIIPDWERLKREITALTNRFPYLNYIAWDILLTEEGFCVIEANASSGCMMFQVEHGVRNEEIGAIYRSYGVIE